MLCLPFPQVDCWVIFGLSYVYLVCRLSFGFIDAGERLMTSFAVQVHHNCAILVCHGSVYGNRLIVEYRVSQTSSFKSIFIAAIIPLIWTRRDGNHFCTILRCQRSLGASCGPFYACESHRNISWLTSEDLIKTRERLFCFDGNRHVETHLEYWQTRERR